MRRWIVLAGGLALASCSPDAPQAAAPERQPAAAPPLARSGLTADVSALRGDVSALNVRITDYGTVIDLPADALFDFDRATLTPVAAAELAKAADLIRRSPPGPIAIVGHTDGKGEDAYNLRLSEARARTVADWFGGQVGVRQRRFDVSGKGEAAPIAPNTTSEGEDDPAGRARNRRVEVVLPK